jgi:Ca-activated chloride channel family protein
MRKIALYTVGCLSAVSLLPACSADYSYSESGYLGSGGTSSGGPGDDESEPSEDDSTGDGDDEPTCNDLDEVVLYLSPDDSNSMSSPVQIRDEARAFGALGVAPVRVWEIMNYYGFPYPPAVDGEMALHAAMEPLEGSRQTWRLQLAVSSEAMSAQERPPMNVTLVLDTSGSMTGEPIELLKETCRAIASQLREGDTVSMVEWDIGNTWTLGGHPISGPNDPVLLEAIDELDAGGGTDLNGGLVSGYQLAQQVYDESAINRLVLISDGGANAGVTDVELIAQNAQYGGSDGIYLVGVGVGQGLGYNDQLMDTVTDAGKGASVFIPSDEEAWTVFGSKFENTLAVAGRDVQVELTMPPGFQIVKFSGEEYSGNPKEIEPQHIAPNDAMVFHQQIRTCAPELVVEDAEFTVTATWKDPWTFESKQISQTWTYAELIAANRGLLRKGAAVLAYSEALLASNAAQFEPAFDAIESAQELLPNDPDLAEMAEVLEGLEN